MSWRMRIQAEHGAQGRQVETRSQRLFWRERNAARARWQGSGGDDLRQVASWSPCGRVPALRGLSIDHRIRAGPGEWKSPLLTPRIASISCS